MREVQLPLEVPGRLFLQSMPGLYGEDVDELWRQLEAEQLGSILSLASMEEVRRSPPAYATAIDEERVPFELRFFPIDDYGVPADKTGFWKLAREQAELLSDGRRLLIHCGAGVGRTGTLAICVLLALGEPLAEAEKWVSSAGSSPETEEQRDLVRRCADQARIAGFTG